MSTREGFIHGDSARWEEMAKGVQRRILGHDPSLMMMHVMFAKGAIGYVHTHPHRQVTFIERGKFEVQVGKKKEILGPGDCYFIPPDVEHGVVALEEGSLVDVFTPAREDILAAQR